MRAARPWLAAVIIAGVLLSAAPASAQLFGKNKVQYEPLDWSVLETPHLRMHYYAEEESLARALVVFAESVCVEFDGRFRMERRNKVPFLLYSAHHLFQQTNATSGFISEGTGGLTEFIKGRVLLPHTGSWRMLRWVTRHELAHWYMLEKLARVMRENKRGQGYLPPLWFTEGFAEYCGTTWDAEAEGMLRDAVLSDNAYPLTRSEPIIGTVLMYKEGQSFLLYLSERFGPEKVFDLFDNWHRGEDFESTFRLTFGVPLATLDEEWFDSIRKRYYPVVAEADRARDVARRLTHRGRYNLGARAVPPANPADTTVTFCYFQAGESGIQLMLSEIDERGRRQDRRLLRSGQSPAFESFHLFQNRPDASPGRVVLSSKRGGRDALYVLDLKSGDVVHRAVFPTLVSVNDPALLPGDRAVVFSAQDYGGRSDLYRVTWGEDGHRLERLTNDDYDDIEPDASPDGRWIVFASDRADRGGHYSLFRISLETGRIEQVSAHGEGDDRQPVYSPDGQWLAFRSTRDGISDLYVRPAEPSSQFRRVTQLTGPAMDPDWLTANGGLVFTGQDGFEFQTYVMRFDLDTLAVRHETPGEVASLLPTEVFEEEISPYQRRLGLDLVTNALSYDPGLGTGGGGAVALSDMLGNEQLLFYLGNDSERFGDFWDGFEGGLTYVNRAQRLNWGVGLFRLTQIYDADLDLVRRERRVGIVGLASYPFSKFTRIEGSVLVRHASDHLLRNGTFDNVDLVSNFATIVYDNTGWSFLGPSAGSRMFFSAGVTRDMSSGAGDFGTLIGDWRHYERVANIVSATRVQGQSSHGRDAGRFYLGGFNSLRGFDRRALAGTQTVLVQQELRFPLVRGLVFAIPAPWMFPTVSGALFADAAWGWDDGFRDRRGVLGSSVYLGGGYYPVIRWNFVWRTDDWKTFDRNPRTQFVIGINF
jgi:Tol biopolymer transport system component